MGHQSEYWCWFAVGVSSFTNYFVGSCRVCCMCIKCPVEKKCFWITNKVVKLSLPNLSKTWFLLMYICLDQSVDLLICMMYDSNCIICFYAVDDNIFTTCMCATDVALFFVFFLYSEMVCENATFSETIRFA